MASVDLTPDAEADLLGLGLSAKQLVNLVEGIIRDLSFMPSRHPACPAAGPLARRYHEGPFLVVYDVDGPAGNETVLILNVLPARGLQAGRTVT